MTAQAVQPVNGSPLTPWSLARALLQFANAAIPDVIYIDSMAGDLFLEEDSDVRRYRLIFWHLRAVATSPDASQALIASLAAPM